MRPCLKTKISLPFESGTLRRMLKVLSLTGTPTRMVPFKSMMASCLSSAMAFSIKPSGTGALLAAPS